MKGEEERHREGDRGKDTEGKTRRGKDRGIRRELLYCKGLCIL